MILFPTGKSHVSYSEVKCWSECSYRHKLTHIDKIDLGETSPYLFFGTAVHSGCESIVKGQEIDREGLLEGLRNAWLENGFDDPKWLKRQPSWFKHKPLEEWCSWATNMWDDVPSFLDETFPGWEPFEAEEQLYESIENRDLSFKGFIDAVIKVKNKKGEDIYWILDWKTAPKYGWRRQKKQDILVTAQIVLYKYYWSIKHKIPLENIRCGFILLKREAVPGKICDLVTVSAGPKTLQKAHKMVGNMISSVKRKLFLKNRDSCRFCQYKDTEFCT